MQTKKGYNLINIGINASKGRLYPMKSAGSTFKLGRLALVLLALAVIYYVLFQYPQPGIADQGDFDRVMNVSGLRLPLDNINDSNFVRFLDYPVTDYQIYNLNTGSIITRLTATSMTFLITLISLICQMAGQTIFKTGYLALAYAIIYVSALYLIMKYMNIKSGIKLAIFGLITLLVCLDGNYLVWFNSLYGEPMMITALTLYMAAWAGYLHHRYVMRVEAGVFPRIVFIIAAAYLLLGSKMQVLSALPILLIMVGKLLWDNRQLLKPYQKWLAGILYCVLIIYPLGLGLTDQDTNNRQYNSVFYGILKDSPHPAQDLSDLGLNPDMAVEAGKHSFQDKADYVKYVPNTQITQQEFYSQMSNLKLIQFYITHPARLLQGMEYTAGQAFATTTFLGKYSREYSETPVREFNRFTWWSSFREQYLPKHLWFIGLTYLVITSVSLLVYFRNREFPGIKSRIGLLWGIMAIGLLQFPMPYVGNGQADTSKQLFLFNFIFDLLLTVSVCWGLSKLIDVVSYYVARSRTSKTTSRLTLSPKTNYGLRKIQ